MPSASSRPPLPQKPPASAPASAANRKTPPRLTPHGSTRPRDYLDRNSDSHVSLAELARFAGVSPTHLQRAFQRAFGLSPRAYQSAQRAQSLAAKLPRARSVTIRFVRFRLRIPRPRIPRCRPHPRHASAPRQQRRTRRIDRLHHHPHAVSESYSPPRPARGLCRVAFADTSGSLTAGTPQLPRGLPRGANPSRI